LEWQEIEGVVDNKRVRERVFSSEIELAMRSFNQQKDFFE